MRCFYNGVAIAGKGFCRHLIEHDKQNIGRNRIHCTAFLKNVVLALVWSALFSLIAKRVPLDVNDGIAGVSGLFQQTEFRNITTFLSHN
jgi:hypothetical protein